MELTNHSKIRSSGAIDGVYLMCEVFSKFLFGTCQSLLLNIHLVNTLDLTTQLFINANCVEIIQTKFRQSEKGVTNPEKHFISI